MTSVYVRSVITEDRPEAPQGIHANLHPFNSDLRVERWEPGRIFAILPFSKRLSEDRMYGKDTVFGASDANNVFVTGYVLRGEGSLKNVERFTDGGTIGVTFGMPTVPGPGVVHMFAVVGSDLIPQRVQDSRHEFVKLEHHEVVQLFRDQPKDAFEYIASHHAQQFAMDQIQQSRSQRG